MQTKVKSTSTLRFNVPPKLTIQMRSAISVAQMRGGREVTDERTKRGSKEKLMKEPNIGPTNKTGTQKTPSTEEVISITPGISSSSNKGGKRKVTDVSSSKRGTKKKLKKKPKIKSKKKSSSPKATSPLQRFGISNFRATAQETLTTKKGILITRSGLTSSKMKGKKGITTGSSPNRGAKRKLKKGLKNKPKKKGNGPKKNESQKRKSKIRPKVPSTQRFDISNSETSAPKKDKTKNELIKAKSLKGLKLKIPEEYPEDLRRTVTQTKEKIGDEQDIMMESGYNGDYPDYLHPTESTPLEPEELPSGYEDEEEALNNTVLVRNETLITNNASKKSYYSDKPLVCWHCSSIVSFDCEKLESVYGEPPEVHGRLTTSCRSGYCGYYSWISDYGYGTEIHQRSCADNPETFCNDSNAFLELINTTSFVKKCTVCNTTMCNDSFLRSINSVLVVLIFLKAITIHR
ncbi:hypothetical protein GE061_015714 [Apolygus lucorum]|uniref:Uncharacterized protein n=1 Tax=Apolygus lucorum TaxID=248454 RepID=A0A8S9XMW9_APOLU|nr:hypothetical protein GE061_015714 [Apolygus lucorum]